MGEDGSVIMAGNTGHTPTYAAAAKFDENGTLLWEWQVLIVVTAGMGIAVLLANCDEPCRTTWRIDIGNL